MPHCHSVGVNLSHADTMVRKKRACIEGSNRVIRGGSWNNNPENCRVANRNRNNPDNRNNNTGFRLVFVP